MPFIQGFSFGMTLISLFIWVFYGISNDKPEYLIAAALFCLVFMMALK